MWCIGPGASSGDGIFQSSIYHSLTVKNGKITHWEGSLRAGTNIKGDSVILSNLQAFTNSYGITTGGFGTTISYCTANGNTASGIYVDSGSTVSDCTANHNLGDAGISTGDGCTISGCSANDNSYSGFSTGDACTILGCTAQENGYNGILTKNNSTISKCTAYNNNSNGIYVGHDSTISGCTACHNLHNGIWIYYGVLVANCVCDNNGRTGEGAGIYAFYDKNRIKENSVADNARGIDVDEPGNFIVKNTATGNVTNYDITGAQTIGPIITASGTITSENPWANFSF